MDLISVLLLSLLIGFFALFIGVKVFGGHNENAAGWQIFVFAIFLFAVEAGANLAVWAVQPPFETRLLVIVIFTGIGLLVWIVCTFKFWTGFIRALLIALLFVGSKAGFSMYIGSKHNTFISTGNKILSIFESPSDLHSKPSGYRDPGWNRYTVNHLSMRLPSPPPEDSDTSTSGESRTRHEREWTILEYPGATIRLEYLNFKTDFSPNVSETITSIRKSEEGENSVVNVTYRDREFQVADPDTAAEMVKIVIGDPQTDPLATAKYAMSAERDQEQWIVEIGGEKKMVEKLALFALPSFRPAE